MISGTAERRTVVSRALTAMGIPNAVDGELLECSPDSATRGEGGAVACAQTIEPEFAFGDSLPVPHDTASASSDCSIGAMVSGVLDYQAKAAAAALKVGALSKLEVQVLRRLAYGHSNKMIGGDLGMEVRAVEICRASIMAKLNAQSVSDAVRVAIYAGLGD